MAESLDVDAMLQRLRDPDTAVRKRNLPPVADEERSRLIAQAQTDFQDVVIIGDAGASLHDDILSIRVDLRPPGAKA